MPRVNKKWLSRQIAGLHSGTVLLRKEISNEALHTVRVAIKALKSMLLQQGLSKKEYKKNFAGIALLFRTCAVSRDCRIMIEKLHSLPAFEWCIEFEKQIKNQLTNADRSVKELLNEKKFQFQMEGELCALRKQQKEKLLSLSPLRKACRQTLVEQPELWHEWRKKIKAFGYMQTAIGTPTNNEKNKEFQALQHTIGEWHDWQNIIAWLRQHPSTCPLPNYDLLRQQAESQGAFLHREIEHIARSISL